MALMLGRKKRTPETGVMRAVMQAITFKNYLWVDPKLIEKCPVEMLVQMVSQRSLKGLAWRSNTGAASSEAGNFVRFGLPGYMDITVLQVAADRKSLRWIGIELKKAKGKLNPNQVKLHAMMNALTPGFPNAVVIRDASELDGVI
ncbi:MAG: hypothetical protein IPK83_18635 [Planctomycetes bacterium]|nr:hypothetical protein [Planctomycetota bacterium]